MSDEPTTSASDPTDRRRRRWIIWGIAAVVAAVVLFYGAIFVYTEFINDPEEELTTADLAEALAAPTTIAATTPASTGTGPGTTAGTPATDAPATDAPPATTASGASTDGVIDGAWTVTTASELGYRVKENLFGVDTEAVGRTNQITGALTITGTQVTAADFTVDMATLSSDESRRDDAFRGRVMSVDEFPTATFVLTQPIELGAVPAAGEQITATATGDLTLRGVTNSVTFDVTAQLEGDRIGVLGNIPVVFADYGIANPSSSGITTEDEGLLEFVLVFER